MLILLSFTFGLSAATAVVQHGGGGGGSGRGGGDRSGSGGEGHGVGGFQGGGVRGGGFDSGGGGSVFPISNPADWCHSNPYYPWSIAMEANAQALEYCNDLFPNPTQTWWTTKTQQGAFATVTSTVATTTVTRTKTATSVTKRVAFVPPVGGVTKRDDPFSAFLGQGQVVVRKVCQCLVKPEEQESFTLTRTRTVGESGQTKTVRVTATSTAITTTTSTTTPLGSKSQSRAGAPQCDPNSELGGQGVGGCNSDCFCDIDADGVNRYCDAALPGDALKPCTADTDCKRNQACMDFLLDGEFKCYSFSTCSSTFLSGLERNEQ